MKYSTVENLVKILDTFHESARPTTMHLGTVDGRYQFDKFLELHWPQEVAPHMARANEARLEECKGIKWNQTFIEEDGYNEKEQQLRHIVSRYELGSQ